MKIMVTGHRPERINGKEKEIEEWLDSQLLKYQPTIAISGMASGVDQIFANLALKRNINLAAVLPYRRAWDSYHPVVQDMLVRAKEVVYACDKYNKQGYFIRDCIMVDAADVVLAIWDGKEWGGTWNTIKYAREQGKDIEYLMIKEN